MFLSMVNCLDFLEAKHFHAAEHEMGLVAVGAAVHAALLSQGEKIDERFLFPKDKKGKPQLAVMGKKDCGIEISISHSFPFALGLANSGVGRVGCDVERVRDFISSTTDAFLTQKEKNILNAYSPRVKKIKTTLAWSYKESILKAIGTGLRTHPSKVDVSELLKIKKQHLCVVKISHKTLMFQAWHKVLKKGYVVVVVAELV